MLIVTNILVVTLYITIWMELLPMGGNMLTEKSHTQYQNLLFQLTLSKIAHQFKQECMKNVKNSYTKY